MITGILVDEYSNSRKTENQAARISLKDFYLRRARRILPAASLVTIAVLVFSWVVNSTARFQSVANDALWSTLFSANLNFALKSTDYFEIGAAPSSFQHFWSLSVEEQFYFLWPALMLAVLSFRALEIPGKPVRWKSRLTALFIATTFISATIMVVTFYFQPSLSYFLTSSRAWELSAGALAALVVRSGGFSANFMNSKVVAHLPIPLLIFSMFFVRSDNFGYTMPLVVFAAVILVSKPADSSDLDAKLLSIGPIRFVGNMSYSLYLWHWPILTFGTELGFAETINGKLALAALSFGLATFTYYFVERKFQKIRLPNFHNNKSTPLSKSLWIGVSSLLLVGVLAVPSIAVQPAAQSLLANFMSSGHASKSNSLLNNSSEIFKKRVGSNWLAIRQAKISSSNKAIAKRGRLTGKQIAELDRVSRSETYAESSDFPCTFKVCPLGDPTAKIRILLLGDSHAAMYHPTFSALKRSGLDIYVYSMVQGLCPNFSGTRSLKRELEPKVKAACVAHHKSVLDFVKTSGETFDYVILSDSKNYYPANYVADATEYVKLVKKIGKKTIILSQAPVNRDVSACLNKDYSNYIKCALPLSSSVEDFTVAKNAKVAFGDIGSLFCVGTYCPIVIGDSSVATRSHLTDSGGIQIAPYFLDFLKDSKVPSK